MPTIQKEQDVLTLINVFSVSPENQEKLVKVLTEATDRTMRHQPGFVSANIHRSLDGKKVVNYAQWASMDDFEAMRKNPEAAPHMQAASALAHAEPILCEVAESISNQGNRQ
jgi:quinol monooxygenase YgiN